MYNKTNASLFICTHSLLNKLNTTVHNNTIGYNSIPLDELLYSFKK